MFGISFRLFLILTVGINFTFLSFASNSSKSAENTVEVINIFPHDTEAFTQGLEYYEGLLYESTGIRGKSSLRKVKIESGTPVKQINLNSNFFGEGLTILNDKVYQLTWVSRIGFIYNKENLEYIGSFSYKTQGWGITNNGHQLIYSDGSSKLYFMEPESFKISNVLNIIDKDGQPVRNLNELEYVKGKIYANILNSDKIVKINPKTGTIEKWIDLSFLRKMLKTKNSANVLNGIAYNPANNTFYITGKFWSNIFEIKIN